MVFRCPNTWPSPTTTRALSCWSPHQNGPTPASTPSLSRTLLARTASTLKSKSQVTVHHHTLSSGIHSITSALFQHQSASLSLWIWPQMTQSLQVQWNWTRISWERWLYPGLPLRMRGGMTGCTTWWRSATPPNGRGRSWLTTSSTTSSRLSTCYLGPSITSEFLLKTTSGFRHLLILRHLKSKRKKVCESPSWTNELHHLQCKNSKGLKWQTSMENQSSMDRQLVNKGISGLKVWRLTGCSSLPLVIGFSAVVRHSFPSCKTWLDEGSYVLLGLFVFSSFHWYI